MAPLMADLLGPALRLGLIGRMVRAAVRGMRWLEHIADQHGRRRDDGRHDSVLHLALVVIRQLAPDLLRTCAHRDTRRGSIPPLGVEPHRVDVTDEERALLRRASY
jgi:hypothetical protein